MAQTGVRQVEVERTKLRKSVQEGVEVVGSGKQMMEELDKLWFECAPPMNAAPPTAVMVEKMEMFSGHLRNMWMRMGTHTSSIEEAKRKIGNLQRGSIVYPTIPMFLINPDTDPFQSPEDECFHASMSMEKTSEAMRLHGERKEPISKKKSDKARTQHEDAVSSLLYFIKTPETDRDVKVLVPDKYPKNSHPGLQHVSRRAYRRRRRDRMPVYNRLKTEVDKAGVEMARVPDGDSFRDSEVSSSFPLTRKELLGPHAASLPPNLLLNIIGRAKALQGGKTTLGWVMRQAPNPVGGASYSVHTKQAGFYVDDDLQFLEQIGNTAIMSRAAILGFIPAPDAPVASEMNGKQESGNPLDSGEGDDVVMNGGGGGEARSPMEPLSPSSLPPILATPSIFNTPEDQKENDPNFLRSQVPSQPFTVNLERWDEFVTRTRAELGHLRRKKAEKRKRLALEKEETKARLLAEEEAAAVELGKEADAKRTPNPTPQEEEAVVKGWRLKNGDIEKVFKFLAAIEAEKKAKNKEFAGYWAKVLKKSSAIVKAPKNTEKWFTDFASKLKTELKHLKEVREVAKAVDPKFELKVRAFVLKDMAGAAVPPVAEGAEGGGELGEEQLKTWRSFFAFKGLIAGKRVKVPGMKVKDVVFLLKQLLGDVGAAVRWSNMSEGEASRIISIYEALRDAEDAEDVATPFTQIMDKEEARIHLQYSQLNTNFKEFKMKAAAAKAS